MIRSVIAAIISVTVAASSAGQSDSPKAAWLGWSSVLVAIAPDSLGAHLWIKTAGTKDSRPGYFFGTFIRSFAIISR